MKQLTIYEAFDGQKFDNKQKCKEYEESHILYKVSKGIKFYDCKQQEIDPLDHTCLSSLFNEAYYINVMDEAVGTLFEEELSRIECYQTSFDKVGYFMYYEDTWVDLEERIKEHQKSIDEMKNLLQEG